MIGYDDAGWIDCCKLEQGPQHAMCWTVDLDICMCKWLRWWVSIVWLNACMFGSKVDDMTLIDAEWFRKRNKTLKTGYYSRRTKKKWYSQRTCVL